MKQAFIEPFTISSRSAKSCGSQRNDVNEVSQMEHFHRRKIIISYPFAFEMAWIFFSEMEIYSQSAIKMLEEA